MMFTQEYLEQLESILGTEWVKTANNIEDKVLYEIQRLQRDNEFIAIQRDRVLEQSFKIGREQRVYCTADGEYPRQGEVVYFEIYDVHYLGKFIEKDSMVSRWKDFADDNPYDWYKLDVPIYWKPLTSLKDEYEWQKENA